MSRPITDCLDKQSRSAVDELLTDLETFIKNIDTESDSHEATIEGSGCDSDKPSSEIPLHIKDRLYELSQHDSFHLTYFGIGAFVGTSWGLFLSELADLNPVLGITSGMLLGMLVAHIVAYFKNRKLK